MALTLNMVGGGSGGMSATDAILRVQALPGATVTITKGAVTKTDLGHENIDDPTTYDYYFIIHQSQFDSVNPWTVTATNSDGSYSKTVVIDTAGEYNLSLFMLSLLVDGQAQTALGSIYKLGGSGTWNITDEYVYLFGSAGNATIVLSATNGFDVTKFSKFRVEAKTGGTPGAFTDFGIQRTHSTNRNDCLVKQDNISSTQEWYELDISNITGSVYLFLESVGLTGAQLYVYNIELVS